MRMASSASRNFWLRPKPTAQQTENTTPGQMQIIAPRDNIQAVDPTLARQWITVQNDNYPNEPTAIQYLSFNAPLGVPEDKTCGRAVFTDAPANLSPRKFYRARR